MTKGKIKVESKKERRRRQRKEHRARLEELLAQKKPSQTRRIIDATLIAGGIAAFGYLLFVQLPANFSPSSQSVLNWTDPFSAEFSFINEGFFAAHDVQPECSDNFIEMAGLKSYGNRFLSSKQEERIVRGKDRLTFSCLFSSYVKITPIKAAD